MSEILRDIEKELKRERWFKLWQQYKVQVIFGVTTFLLLALVFGALYFYNKSQSEKASADFDYALSLNGQSSLEVFSDLADQKNIYGALAGFHEAAILAKTSRWKKAVIVYDGLSTNGNLPQSFRDLAKLNAAQVLLGRAKYKEIESRLKSTISNNGSLRYSALEILALAAIEDKNLKLAQDFLKNLVDDAAVPSTLAARAQIMLDNLLTKQAGKKPKK